MTINLHIPAQGDGPIEGEYVTPAQLELEATNRAQADSDLLDDIEAGRFAQYRVQQDGGAPFFDSIQEAIDAAIEDGHDAENPAVVVVEPGVYTENVTITEQGIYVQGAVRGFNVVYAATLKGKLTVNLSAPQTATVTAWADVDIDNSAGIAVEVLGSSLVKLVLSNCVVRGGSATEPAINAANTGAGSELRFYFSSVFAQNGATTAVVSNMAKLLVDKVDMNVPANGLALAITNSGGYSTLTNLETSGRVTIAGSSPVTINNALLRGGTNFPLIHSGSGTLVLSNSYLETSGQTQVVSHTGSGAFFYAGTLNWASSLQSLPGTAMRLPGAPIGPQGPAGAPGADSTVPGPAGADGVDGASAYEVAVANGFIGTEPEWLASLVGADGADSTVPGPAGADGADSTVPGPAGADGLSAFEVAVSNGFVGTEAAWLSSLVGPAGADGADSTVPGPAGADSTVPGPAGADGVDGLSAYEVAIANGFVGTEPEWLASLVGTPGADGADGADSTVPGPAGADGANGDSAYTVAVANGFVGTEVEWLSSLVGVDGLDGVDGASAYEVAVANGFMGTEAEWLSSLVGPAGADGADSTVPGPAGADGADSTVPGPAGADGIDGLSAYEVAVANGFIGTEPEWLVSLVGPAGADGADGADSTVPGPAGADGADSTVPGPAGADGASAYEVAVAAGFVGTEVEWLTALQGETGAPGDPGATGDSAYTVAVSNGFVGTEAEWLSSLIGAPGADGADGADSTVPGPAGTDGIDGASAYEIAVANGFVGTEAAWLVSLVGPAGADGADGADSTVPGPAGADGADALWNFTGAYNGGASYAIGDVATNDGKTWYRINANGGNTGDTPAEGTFWTLLADKGLDGSDGDSAYTIAVTNGFVGTEAQWLTSLIGADGADGAPGADSTVPGPTGLPGDPGADGASAYEVAVANGFVGTEAAWLASLVGAQGNAGADGDKYQTNSTDTIALANYASLTINVEVGLAYSVTQDIAIAHDVDHHMHGEVLSYNNVTGEMSVHVTQHTGSGTFSTWTINLEGAAGVAGTDGLSAYEVAVANGFVGTEAAWLASLIGETGPQGPQGNPATWVGLSQNFYIDAATGNDSTGNGSEAAPYATIDAAIAAKGALSGFKIYNVGRGTYVSTTLASFPTNTFIKGQAPALTTISVTGAVTLADAWAGSSSTVFSTSAVIDCLFSATSGMTFDFFAKASLYGRLSFVRATLNGALTYNAATAANLFNLAETAVLGAFTFKGPGVGARGCDFYNLVTQDVSSSTYISGNFTQNMLTSLFRSTVNLAAATGSYFNTMDARTSEFAGNVTISGAMSILLASPTTVRSTATITQSAGSIDWSATSKMQKFVPSNTNADWTGQSTNWNAFPETIYAALTELAARVKTLGG